ncbi:uncharacterized protein EI90DRAFT_3052570 [Cantharellus anzutake]|uniref:uncharacterized protein n=1 Tax=Cantharellus anzutake TaxID=1750568 RepID=UPI001902CDDE|nr:uncharacterized protein EI90DRAFT_3052570 [Cantharellus anzutake]KAF8333612.1 hypothetical protein EI90DRAFT_3052570 [Cantharellus anzutake]
MPKSSIELALREIVNRERRSPQSGGWSTAGKCVSHCSCCRVFHDSASTAPCGNRGTT